MLLRLRFFVAPFCLCLCLCLSLSLCLPQSLSLSTSTSWSHSSGSAAALAFNFVCLCSCVCIRSASTPRLALCGRRQFIFGTLTAPCLVLSHSPHSLHSQCPLLSRSDWQACAFALTTHTHTQQQLQASVCVCARVCIWHLLYLPVSGYLCQRATREQQKLPLALSSPMFSILV